MQSQMSKAFASLRSEKERIKKDLGTDQQVNRGFRIEAEEAKKEERRNLLSKLRLIDALLSPNSFLATTLYLPASSTATSLISIVAK
jgi:hypothetical protein